MRFLLISDTHGKLGVIDELASQVLAEAVIHAAFPFPPSATEGKD